MKIDKLTANLHDTMKEIIVKHSSDDMSEFQILKTMLIKFAEAGKKKNLPTMQQVVIDFVKEEYPNLKEEFDRLLILI